MASKLLEAMAMKDIASLQDAARIVGRGHVNKAREICALARVDHCDHSCLEPQLLKEWLAKVPSEGQHAR